MPKHELTKEQKAVVHDNGGTLLVSAAAGSGKTTVLIDRVIRIVEEKNCDVDRFLMITFTKAAAAELRGKLIGRLSELLAERPDDRRLQAQMSRVYLTQISTVHAFCASVLRDYAHVIDVPADFSVCEDREADVLRERAMQTVLDSAYEELEEGSDVAAALNMLGVGRNDKKLPELIGKLYESLQSYSDPQQRLEILRKSIDCASFKDAGETIWGKYLIEQFHKHLDHAQVTMQKAADLCEGPFVKYLAGMKNSIEVIRSLKALNTWEEIRSFSINFIDLERIEKKDNADPDMKKHLQDMRNGVKKSLSDWKAKFSLSSEDALSDLSAGSAALRGLFDLTERFAKRFAENKERAHVLDYDDLEHKMLRLVRIRSVAQEIAARYEQIMVDEYQDTNEVQDEIFRLISDDGKNLFFVGDVKQSIYGFRRADPTIFLEKYKTFANYTEEKDGEPRKILLSHNFRSHPAILEAVNDVFRLTMTENVGGLRYGDAEALRHPDTPVTEMPTYPVELHCIEKEKDDSEDPATVDEVEAEFVADRIRAMLHGGELIPDGSNGLRPILEEDIVILLRALKGHAEAYQAALAKRGIKCVCANENIFETEEIMVLFALLRAIDNPHQDVPLASVLLSPLFGCTADELALARANRRGGDLYTVMKDSDSCKRLDELRTAAQTTSVRRLLDIADERLFIRTIFGAMEEGAQRLQNIDRFFALADSYESGSRYGLSGFVAYLDSLSEKGQDTEGVSTGGAVRITTIHKSKGLEYPVVFLSDLFKDINFDDSGGAVLINSKLGIASEVYDPERMARYPTFAKHAISERICSETRSEEMRVLYVGMTRAKYRLVMTGCRSSLQTKVKKYADELSIPAPDGLIESAKSMGDWVLMTALTHTEAGELFQVGGNPGLGHLPEYPWTIRYHRSSELLSADAQPAKTAEETEKIEYVPLRYPHEKAVGAPSKVTATQLKGRVTDEEISEDTAAQPLKLPIRKPQFSFGKRALTGAERGTAIHLAMQYIRYDCCTDTDSVKKELDRLVDMRFLTPQQREAVPEEKILNFFRSDVGMRVLAADRVVREYKFSVLEDGSLIDPALAGEEILLQGVTDCCLIESGELTILDFKSDHVKPGQEGEKADFYRGQLDAYARALSKVLGLPVKERILYFFSTDSAINA